MAEGVGVRGSFGMSTAGSMVPMANGCGMVAGVERSEEWSADLEPFFFDEAEAIADHERRMRKQQEEARKKELQILAAEAHEAVRAKIRDYDIKQGGVYYTRFCYADFNTFDLDEESPLEPMRYTDKVYKRGGPFIAFTGIDFISLKIASLDIDFPIFVYGTVIARDCIDSKCVYLFQRSKDNCQLISSKDESLILTGPKRGLLLLDNAFVEVDLKIKDHEGQEKELSKGILSITGTSGRYMDKCEVESESLATRLSTVEVEYAVVKDAVEATIEIEVLQGDFFGKITSCTSSISNPIVLHDSKVAGVMICDGKRVIELLRRVVAVCREEKLEVTVAQSGDDVTGESTIAFTPDICGGARGEITIGATKMIVKVIWSVIHSVL